MAGEGGSTTATVAFSLVPLSSSSSSSSSSSIQPSGVFNASCVPYLQHVRLNLETLNPKCGLLELPTLFCFLWSTGGR